MLTHPETNVTGNGIWENESNSPNICYSIPPFLDCIVMCRKSAIKQESIRIKPLFAHHHYSIHEMPFVEVSTSTGKTNFYYTISTPTCTNAKVIDPLLPVVLFFHPIVFNMVFHCMGFRNLAPLDSKIKLT